MGVGYNWPVGLFPPEPSCGVVAQEFVEDGLDALLDAIGAPVAHIGMLSACFNYINPSLLRERVARENTRICLIIWIL